MVEPKGGPVKPPILDLKPSKSSTKKPAGNPKTPNNNKTTNQNTPQSAKPDQTAPASKARDAIKNSSAGPAIKTTTPQKSSPSYITIAMGAALGAATALILISALILFGILKPLNQTFVNADLTGLSDRVGITEEQVTQNLVGFSVMDEQVNALRQQITSRFEQIQPELAQLSARLDAIEQMQNTIQQNQTDFASRLDAFQTDPQLVTQVTTLGDNVTELSTRLDAVAAGASLEDASKFGADIAQIRQELALLQSDLDQRLTDFQTQSQDEQTGIRNDIEANVQSTSEALSARLDAALTLIETNTANIAGSISAMNELATSNTPPPSAPPVTQTSLYLPLALLGFEEALATGQPFANELQSINSFLPELQIPDLVFQAAQNGLPTPATIISEFNKSLPLVIGARPLDTTAGWMQRIGDGIKSILALRPTDQINGDAIDNLISRAESAINNFDFATASQILAKLPPPMKQALGELSEQITALGNSRVLLRQAKNMAIQISTRSLPGASAQ